MHYNALKSNTELCSKLEDYLVKFFLYMYEEWKAMGIFKNIVDNSEKVTEGYKSGKSLIEYLTEPTLCVDPQGGEGVGYGIECECPWEPEHQCMIIIRNDDLLYVGQSNGLDPWGDEDDYYCIWHDEA